MTSIEWPRNSGRVAEYDNEELRQVRELLAQGTRDATRSVEFLHALKVDLDAKIVPYRTVDGEERHAARMP